MQSTGMQSTGSWRRRGIAAASACAMLAAQLPLAAVPTSARAQSLAPTGAQPATQITSSSGIMSRTEYEACQARDEPAFRKAIEDLTYKGLRTGLAGVDYSAVVHEEWRRIDFDQLLDKQVDIAINEVREETSWTSLMKSIGSEEQARTLATAVAERVYKSETVKKGLEQLATGVGRALGKRIETATSDTAEPAMQCMQAFLGPRYGNTVARLFSRDAGKEYQVDPSKSGAEVSTGAVLANSAGGISGAIILLVRRQLAGMASRIGSRVVGSVVARLVGAVAGGVGLVLIAKDIWDFRHGVLPIIATEMKSKPTKDKVQEELARAIQEQIGDNIREISGRTADRILEIWHEFKRAHAKVLDLAGAHPAFKQFLEQLKPDALARLDEVVSLVAAKEGDTAVLARLDNGTLNEAVNRMPAQALDIARDTRSLETALAWWSLAGNDIERVVESELHRLTTPASLTKATFTRLVGLNDKVAISRLAALPADTRQTLFELDTAELRRLGHALDTSELQSLAGYLTGLDKASSSRILRAVAQTPSKMQFLSRASVRNGILASQDQAAAVGMMLKADGVPDPFAALEHARYVMDGKVSPILLWEKNPYFVGAFAFMALSMLLMLRRLLFGRRPKVIVQTVEAKEPKRAANAPPIRTRQ